jgi:hypothetical protein
MVEQGYRRSTHQPPVALSPDEVRITVMASDQAMPIPPRVRIAARCLQD